MVQAGHFKYACQGKDTLITCGVACGNPDTGSRREGHFGKLRGQGQMRQGLDGGGNGSGAASKCPSTQLNYVRQHEAYCGAGGQR